MSFKIMIKFTVVLLDMALIKDLQHNVQS